MAIVANCSSLASRKNFADYIQEVNITTGFNETLLEACKSNICNALWGTGNADISGIGMLLGYFLASILGIFFSIAFFFHEPFTESPITKKGKLLVMGLDRFFDCTAFFAASIQIACVVVFVRKDFGINANGLGSLTVQITWTVALLCMLPLLYPMVILEFTDRDHKDRDHNDHGKSGYRLFLFCGCWMLFFYTYISQMIGDFGPSQVGTGAGSGGSTIITTEEWNQLTSLCLSGVRDLSTLERKALKGFSAAGASAISVYGLILLLWFIAKNISAKNNARTKAGPQSSRFKILGPKESQRRIVLGLLLTIVLVLTIPQFWGFLLLRNIQKALADNTDNVYVDNQWTFGQVVAVVLFVPVFTDVGYEWQKQ